MVAHCNQGYLTESTRTCQNPRTPTICSGLPRGILITPALISDLRPEVDEGPRHVAEPEEP